MMHGMMLSGTATPPVGSDVSVKVGTFAITTQAAGNTVAVTGVGFQPKAVLFFKSNRTTTGTGRSDAMFGFGWAISATERRVVCATAADNAVTGLGGAQHRDDGCIVRRTGSGSTNGTADLTSLDSDGFTVDITQQFTANELICYIALGGDDIAAVKTGTVTEPGATGTQTTTVTDLGGAPDLLIFATIGLATAPPANNAADSTIGIGWAVPSSGQVTWCGGTNNLSDPTDIATYFRTDECVSMLNATVSGVDARATLDSVGSSGSDGTFTLDWLARAGSRLTFYLAIRGGVYRAGTFAFPTTLNGTVSVSGLPAQPKGVLALSRHVTTEDAAGTALIDDERMTLGAFTSSSERVNTSLTDLNNVATQTCAVGLNTDRVLHIHNATPSTVAAIDVSSMDSTGFTLIADDEDVAVLGAYLAII